MPDWPAAVIFDFDGVIVDSEPLHYRAFAELLGKEGMKLTEREYYAEYIGFDDKGAVNYALKKHNRPSSADEVRRLMSAKSRRVQEMIARREYDALPGVREFVTGLSRNGYALGICSGALRHEIEVMLGGVELSDHFSVIVMRLRMTSRPMLWITTAMPSTAGVK